jgi:hypothetical protein
MIDHHSDKVMEKSLLFLEFEEVILASLAFIIILIYLFYIKYPYDKELD